MATVRIEGIPFELDDAEVFANRLRRASAGTSRAGLSPANALAIEIDERLEAGGGGNIEIRDEARAIALAVIDEWYPTAPESAKQLRRLLGA